MPLLQNRLKQAEFIRTVWAATPEPGVTLEEMEKPEFWAHVSKNFKPGDRIEVTAADASWFAELFVRSANANAAVVTCIRKHVFSEPKADGPDVYVKHRGGAGWSVIRKSDKAVLFENGATREDAEAFLRGQSLG